MTSPMPHGIRLMPEVAARVMDVPRCLAGDFSVVPGWRFSSLGLPLSGASGLRMPGMVAGALRTALGVTSDETGRSSEVPSV
jgi:hypothetical protein